MKLCENCGFNHPLKLTISEATMKGHMLVNDIISGAIGRAWKRTNKVKTNRGIIIEIFALNFIFNFFFNIWKYQMTFIRLFETQS